MEVKMEEIIVYMKKLGFTEYESKVYIALLSKHPATAYTISQASGVPHSRVYDIARRLIKKGAAILYGKNPDAFSPISPEELIQKLKKGQNRYINELEKNLNKITFTSNYDPIWNISNRDEALRITRNIIKEAKQKIYLGIWDEELKSLLPEIRYSYNNGIQVFLLIYGKMDIDFGEVFYHWTEDLRGINELGRTIDCAVDSKYCISGSLGREVPCQIIWTRNMGLVKSIEEYIIHDFYLAEIYKVFGKKIEEKFGKKLKNLIGKFRK